jgi:threonine synthase
VLTGLAPNGGLYIPETIPSLPANWRSEWKDYSFVDLSVAVLSLYISSEEISTRELRTLVEKSYATFRHPDVTPLHKLDDKTFVLELFHGPTFAFKDVALQLLGNLFEFFLLRRNARKAPGERQERLTVLGATSGDTGRYVACWHRGFADQLNKAQCRYLWAPQQGKHLDLYSASQGPRLAHPGSSNDHCDRRERAQCRCKGNF